MLGREQTDSDVIVRNHGSIVLVEPKTADAVLWIDEHVGADNGFQPYYPTVACQPRYVAGLVLGMIEDGLKVVEYDP